MLPSAIFIRTLTLFFVIPLMLTGCRTYGAYDSKDKTMTEIERVNDQFARALVRAENDLGVLEEAAARDGRLAPLAERFSAVLAEHGRYVETHRAELEELRHGLHGYRGVSRLFGSIVTDQHSVMNRYRELARRVSSAAGVGGAALRTPGTYQLVPPYFLRVQYRAEDVGVSAAVRTAR